jgi:tRNA threonylcarbamoyladenosine biosynthesis protein TsaB
MLLLGLDTATLTLSLALVDRQAGADKLIDRLDVPPPTPHSSLLPKAIEEMLSRAGIKPAGLGGIVIGLGPGSFTGLRIGLATVKGISFAGKIPLVGASSLAAMALAAAPDLPEGSLLVPALDARKGEVYCGLYRSKAGEVVLEGQEMALAPEKLIEKLVGQPEAHVFGIGREAYAPLKALPEPGTSVRTPDAFALVRLVKQVPDYTKEAAFGLEPHYVRPSDSEWTLKPKKA